MLGMNNKSYNVCRDVARRMLCCVCKINVKLNLSNIKLKIVKLVELKNPFTKILINFVKRVFKNFLNFIVHE